MNKQIMRKHYEATPKETLIDILIASRQEIERLHSIIKEVREYIEHAQNYGKEKVIYVNGNDILEILNKGE